MCPGSACKWSLTASSSTEPASESAPPRRNLLDWFKSGVKVPANGPTSIGCPLHLIQFPGSKVVNHLLKTIKKTIVVCSVLLGQNLITFKFEKSKDNKTFKKRIRKWICLFFKMKQCFLEKFEILHYFSIQENDLSVFCIMFQTFFKPFVTSWLSLF